MKMDIKQGKEHTEFVKEDERKANKYIFQKNAKTKLGTYMIVAFLLLLILGVILSAFFFNTPA